jgi:hypothetical protein
LFFEENLAYNRELASMFDWQESNEQDLKKKYDDLIAKKKEDRKVKVVQFPKIALLLILCHTHG